MLSLGLCKSSSVNSSIEVECHRWVLFGELDALGAEDSVVVCRSFDVLLILFAEDGAHSVRDKLQQQVDWERNERNCDAIDPLKAGETVYVHRDEPAEELRAKNLEDQDHEPNCEEGGIRRDIRKNVDLVIYLSRANHIEYLHENE